MDATRDGRQTGCGRRGLAAALAALALVVAGCESDGINAPEGTVIRVRADPSTVVIDPDDGVDSGSTRLIAEATNESGFPLEDINVTFSTTAGTLFADADLAQLLAGPVKTDSSGVASAWLLLDGSAPAAITVTATSGAVSETTQVNTSETGNLPAVAVLAADPATAQRIGEEVDFIGSGSSDPDGSITCYQWVVASAGGTETVQGTTRDRITREYATEQDLTVTLRVTDAPGLNCSAGAAAVPAGLFDDEATLDYEIVCDLTGPNADAGDDVVATFSAGSATATLDGGDSNDPESGIDATSYTWDCNTASSVDTPQMGQEVDCVYTSLGTFVARLTVENNCGQPDTDTVTVTVQAP